MQPLVVKVRKAIGEQALFERGDLVLAAVSGGPDSVALLHALAEIASGQGFSLAVVHLDHGLRRESAAEAARVGALARQLDLPCFSTRARVALRARRRGISLEMAARECRYEYFRRIAARQGRERGTGLGGVVLATGHTRDDVAETVLLKLARGAGAAGLSGIPLAGSYRGLRIARPLRGIARTEIMVYLREAGIDWCEDESNRDRAFLRNRVRWEVLPLLEATLNPAVRDALARTADVIGEESAWLDTLGRSMLEACVAGGPGSPLDAAVLRAHPKAARRRVLRLWLAACGCPPEAVDFQLVERLDRLVVSRARSGRTAAPGRRLVRRRGDFLEMTTAEADAAPDFDLARYAVRRPGRTRIDALALQVTVRPGRAIVRERGPVIGALPATVSLSHAALRRRRLYVRTCRPGDRIRPLGMRGSQKLQDLFVNAKVPAHTRRRLPLLECGGEIIWIPGFRVARGWHVTDATGPIVEVSFRALA